MDSGGGESLQSLARELAIPATQSYTLCTSVRKVEKDLWGFWLFFVCLFVVLFFFSFFASHDVM